MASDNPKSFSDFPEDVQLSILSFLTPPEIFSFACTSKRSFSLCHTDTKLWFSLCNRRFGSRTLIHKWARDGVTYRHLYKTLSEYESLIGFWRRSGQVKASSQPPLVVFEWGSSFVTGLRVSPSKPGSCYVTKSPFLWLSITPTGAPVSFLDPNSEFEFSDDVDLGFVDSGLVPVSVSFMGKRHVVVEECLSLVCSNGENEGGLREGSLVMSEVYQYFANRTSPGGDRAARRKQKRREKERRKLEPEHFVKIVNCSPTAAKPLQGLWKGIDDDMNLNFFLVEYDDIGGVVCRRVGEWSQASSAYSPVFWTPNTSTTEPPFSPSEQYIYDSRIHLRPFIGSETKAYRECHEVVSRVLDINSSYDLVIPDLAEVSASPRQVEGRIWQYVDGTFGFGFLRNNYIIDLKPIAQDGCLLDAVENCND